MTVPLEEEVVTVAVQVVCEPTTTAEGAQPTEVKLMNGVTVIEMEASVLAVLAPLFESPG